MSTFKKHQVVMLPTNEKAPKHNYLFLYKPSNRIVKNGFVQHLYILSDEEIKEGDWFDGGEYILQCSRVTDVIIDTNGQWSDIKSSKKIIATTDKLNTHPNVADSYRSGNCLPQPSQSFIEKYVEEYNKGNVITEVMVEYEEWNYAPHIKDLDKPSWLELKINLKDNTITIRECKDSWSREEVKALALQSFLEGVDRISAEDFDKWIEKNL